MQADDLVRMANQIAHFFSPYPEEDAVEGVRDHLAKFWDPHMRKELQAIATGLTPSAQALDPLARRAVQRLAPSEHE